MRFTGIAFAVVSTAILAACSTKPTVTREHATMTRAEIDAAGLVCRQDRPPDSNIPRTICASKESWAAFDERRRRETDDLLAEGRKNTNAGRFNRN